MLLTRRWAPSGCDGEWMEEASEVTLPRCRDMCGKKEVAVGGDGLMMPAIVVYTPADAVVCANVVVFAVAARGEVRML